MESDGTTTVFSDDMSVLSEDKSTAACTSLADTQSFGRLSSTGVSLESGTLSLGGSGSTVSASTLDDITEAADMWVVVGSKKAAKRMEKAARSRQAHRCTG